MSSQLPIDFKTNIKEYIDLDKQIKDASKSLTIIRNRKKTLSKSINVYMQQYSIDELCIPGGKIKKVETNRTSSLTKNIILERCILLCEGNEESGKQMADFICDPTCRPKKTSSSIRKYNDRKKKNKN